jgi:hypothetical protein
MTLSLERESRSPLDSPYPSVTCKKFHGSKNPQIHLYLCSTNVDTAGKLAASSKDAKFLNTKTTIMIQVDTLKKIQYLL